MWRLLLASEAAFVLAAPDAKVKVVVVRIAAGRLVQDPRRPQNRLRRALVARCIPKEPRLQLVRAEQPLHTCALVHHERSDEMPISRVVEDEHATAQHSQTEPVEPHPAVVPGSEPAGVSSEEQEVGVTAGAVASVARMRSPVETGEVADAERMATGKHRGDFTGRALDRLDQRRGSVPRALAWSKAPIAVSAVRERDRFSEVPSV